MSVSRHKKAVSLRQTGLSYTEIGCRLGLTRERVRQIITGVSTVKKKPARNNPDTLLTATEAAELLNIHVNTVRRWSNKGILETYRIGPRGDRRFRRRDIDNFLARSNKSKETMRNSRIIKYAARLFLAVIIGLALLGSLPATVQADGNPVELELGGEGATSWDIGNIMPGDSGTKTVTLHSNVDGFVTIWISDLVSSEGINPESETGDIAAPGELDQYLLFNISCSLLDSNISLPTTIDNLPHSASDPDYIKISPLNIGDTVTLVWEWEFPETGEPQNDAQGDSLSFTVNYVNYMLEEFPLPSGGGVGGGGVTLPLGTTDVRGMVGSGCRFSESVSATSEDGLCTLTIPEGTVCLTEELECLTEISMLIMDEPPPPPEDANVIGLLYDFQSSGTTFEPPVTLTFSYDPDNIPEGIAEEDLVIAYYDEEAGEWVNLECTVHPETNTITASISHFTAFAILGHKVVPEATFILDSVVSPTKVDIGETVNVTISVANTGGMAGIYKVTLKINGVVESIRYVTVAAGHNEKVIFTISRDVAASYSVDVNGLTGSFTVKTTPELPLPPAELPPVPPAKEVSWPLVGGIMAAVVVLGLLGFFLIRRRQRRAH